MSNLSDFVIPLDTIAEYPPIKLTPTSLAQQSNALIGTNHELYDKQQLQ